MLPLKCLKHEMMFSLSPEFCAADFFVRLS